MNNDSGLLSIDFIAGFTIFMIAFIIVITMVSGLLVGLSSRSIDFDAIAYRTGAILAEDAGDPGGAGDLNDPKAPGWEVKDLASTAEKKEIVRLGLAISKNFPNILSPAKVDKFFYQNAGLTDNDNLSYKQKLMLFNFNNKDLSTIPTFYHFNIRFKSLDSPSDIPSEHVPNITSPIYSTAYVGEDDSNVKNYGYSRRLVVIKQPSSMNVNLSKQLFDITGTPGGDPNQTQFTVQYNVSELTTSPVSLRYFIDPVNEQTATNVTLNTTSATVKLTDVRTLQYFPNTATPLRLNISPDSPTVRVYLNTNKTDEAKRWRKGIYETVEGNSSVLLVVDPGYLQQSFTVVNATYVSLECTFDGYVTAETAPIPYSYTYPNGYGNFNLTMPFLIPAVMEVKVW
jgi:hypothetical protein